MKLRTVKKALNRGAEAEVKRFFCLDPVRKAELKRQSLYHWKRYKRFERTGKVPHFYSDDFELEVIKGSCNCSKNLLTIESD